MLHILLNVSRFLEYHLYPRNFVKQYANHDPNVKVRIDHLYRGMGIFPWKFAWNIVVNFIVEHHSGYICWDCESAKYKNRKKKKANYDITASGDTSMNSAGRRVARYWIHIFDRNGQDLHTTLEFALRFWPGEKHEQHIENINNLSHDHSTAEFKKVVNDISQ